MNVRETLIALHLTGVIGPRRLKAAQEVFPDLSDVFGSSEEFLAQLPDWTPFCARKVLLFTEPLAKVEKELIRAESAGIGIVVSGDPIFPKIFENLYDPPFVLWKSGDYSPADENAIAVIGCRKPSPYGKLTALRLSEDIARSGYTVVSGLARGIDSQAHLGALKCPKGRTIAFLGSGLLNLYPPENGVLAKEISERGVVFSEYPPNSKPLALHFPQRNRLISGSSKGVLVVEAKKDSGSFITVDHAIDQGKPVFAVPGPINHTESEGAHALIQQGAKLVMGVEDIFHELRDMRAETVFKSKKIRRNSSIDIEDLTAEENLIIGGLSYSPIHVDVLARQTQMPLRRINELLLILEIKGLIQQAPGHCFFKV